MATHNNAEIVRAHAMRRCADMDEITISAIRKDIINGKVKGVPKSFNPTEGSVFNSMLFWAKDRYEVDDLTGSVEAVWVLREPGKIYVPIMPVVNRAPNNVDTVTALKLYWQLATEAERQTFLDAVENDTTADLSQHKSIDEILAVNGLPTEDKRFVSSVGNAARDMYIRRFGTPPIKALRRKTSGKGSHDKAVYPRELMADIKLIINRKMGEFGYEH